MTDEELEILINKVEISKAESQILEIKAAREDSLSACMIRYLHSQIRTAGGALLFDSFSRCVRLKTNVCFNTAIRRKACA